MRHPSRRGTPGLTRNASIHAGFRRAQGLLNLWPVRRSASFSFEVNPMQMKRLFRLVPLVVVSAALAACDSPSGGGGGPVSGDELVFLRPGPGAPHLATYDTTIIATKGEDTELEINYVPQPGESSGDECLRFRIRAESLLSRPDGRIFQNGDTVHIRVRVVDAGYFNFEFQPAGLRFSRSRPAELRVNYQFAHPDYNGDGEVDDDDEDFEFGWYRQEMPGQRWEQIGSVKAGDVTEVRAEIDGFTRYALAGGN
jgi:hypothetical protein